MKRKLKFILVGTGHFGLNWCERVIPAISAFAEIAAVVDQDSDALESVQGIRCLHSVPRYTDAKQALEEVSCDFMALVVRPEHRMPLIDLAVRYGIAVISEKPLADTMDAVCRIYQKVSGLGLKMSVTMSHRFERNKQSLISLISSGQYGRVNYIVCRLASSRRLSAEELTGAVSSDERLISEGVIHEIDTLRAMAHSNVSSVFSRVWSFENEAFLGRSAMLQMSLENGVQCQIEHSTSNATNLNDWGGEYYRAECEKATLILNGNALTVQSHLGYPYPEQAEIPLKNQEYWGHEKLIYDFCQWLQGGEAPPTCLEDNMQCSAAVFAAIQSMHSGRAVDVQEYLRSFMDKYEISG